MVKAIFNNGKKYNVEFSQASAHVVILTGKVAINTSGFQIRRIKDDFLLGDYSEFTTIYQKLTGAVQFSDDGSVKGE